MKFHLFILSIGVGVLFIHNWWHATKSHFIYRGRGIIKLPTLQKQQPVLSSEDKTDTHKTREEKPIHVRKQLAKKWSVSEETLHTSKKVNEHFIYRGRGIMKI